MSNKAKLGIASALIVAIAAAPALACLLYIAQNASTHNCCPQEKPQSSVVARCCVYSPAITARDIDVPAPTIATTTLMAGNPAGWTSNTEALVVPILDTSPPGSSSILRI